MDGPTVYKVLLDAGTLDPNRKLTSFLSRYFESFQANLATELTEQLRQAYLAGVRDGFHEGVAAASRIENSQEGSEGSP